jgi:hypothetical protein
MCFAGGGQQQNQNTMGIGGPISGAGTGQYGPPPTATPAPPPVAGAAPAQAGGPQPAQNAGPQFVVKSIEPQKPDSPVDPEAMGYKGGTVAALDKVSANQMKRKRDQSLVDN